MKETEVVTGITEKVPTAELIIVIEDKAVANVNDDDPIVAGFEKNDSEVEGLSDEDDMSDTEAASDFCIEVTGTSKLSNCNEGDETMDIFDCSFSSTCKELANGKELEENTDISDEAVGPRTIDVELELLPSAEEERCSGVDDIIFEIGGSTELTNSALLEYDIGGEIE